MAMTREENEVSLSLSLASRDSSRGREEKEARS